MKKNTGTEPKTIFKFVLISMGFFVTQLVILTLLAGWTWDPASWKSDPADWKSDLGDGKSDLCDRESKFLLFDTIYATLCFLVALCHI